MNEQSEWERSGMGQELEVATEAARAAGVILRRHFEDGSKTWEKSKGNPVTEADLEADVAIRDKLRGAFPEDAMLTEESGDDGARVDKARCWIVDPMDGTKEFTLGIPEFSVSIALAVAGEPAVGVVYHPVDDVMCSAARGTGCWRNGERVCVSSCGDLARARLFASRSEIEKGRLEPFEGWFDSISPMGSIAWKLALVACGEADLNLSMRPKSEWDVCAGDLLVREAGGRYVDLRGGRRSYNELDPTSEHPMAAGSDALLSQLFERLAASGFDPSRIE
jgi:myo-inositol-1(or 4)-monophosphatase